MPNFLLRQARQARRETQEQTAQAVGGLLGHPVDPEYIGRLERGVVTSPEPWPPSELVEGSPRSGVRVEVV